MDIQFTLDEARKILEAVGIYLNDQLIALLLVFFLLVSIGALQFLGKVLILVYRLIARLLERLRRTEETDRFIQVRSTFAQRLIIEINQMNQDADWNDFYYTRLEAEVELDPRPDIDRTGTSFLKAWVRAVPSLLRTLIGISRAGTSANNLVEAIQRSSSRSFLVIGDPGSGKTVSLRHLALRMAIECANSNRVSAIVPLYLNLKGLNTPPDQVTADSIHKWVLDQVRAGQDRLIDDFLNKHFESMLDKGELFFLFDSFDEIPAVMDAQEDTEVVRQYALAITRFLHSLHTCRGLVSSRPYRAPKVFIGQRMTIKPLNIKRIELYFWLTGCRLKALGASKQAG